MSESTNAQLLELVEFALWNRVNGYPKENFIKFSDGNQRLLEFAWRKSGEILAAARERA